MSTEAATNLKSLILPFSLLRHRARRRKVKSGRQRHVAWADAVGGAQAGNNRAPAKVVLARPSLTSSKWC
jgi:hypothetical protein